MLVVIIAIVAGSHFLNRPKICEPEEDLTSQLRTGDLCFSVGESLKSDIVRMFDGSNDCQYSHVGIVIKKPGEEGYRIVHMSSDLGVIASQTVEDFVKTADSSQLGFHRFKKEVDAQRITEVVDSLIALEKLFDNNFKMDDDEQYYCTEFVYKVLRDAGSEIYNDIRFESHLYPDALASEALMTKIAEIK